MRISKLKFIGNVAASGIAALVIAIPAYADVTVGDTGAGSTNDVQVEQNNVLDTTSDSTIDVTNQNRADSRTGGSVVDGNTTGGSAETGTATNTNKVTTTITAETATIGSGGSQTPGTTGQTGGQGGGTVSVSQPSGTSGGVGGGSLGTPSETSSSGMGGGVLPDTGPNSPIDVTALRNSLLAKAAPGASAPGSSRNLWGGLALLSLAGGVGSAISALRKQAATT